MSHKPVFESAVDFWPITLIPEGVLVEAAFFTIWASLSVILLFAILYVASTKTDAWQMKLSFALIFGIWMFAILTIMIWVVIAVTIPAYYWMIH